MKKVLILAYDFPPYFSMGAQRPWSWYLYFKEFGVYPVVITRHWDNDIKTKADTFKPTTIQHKTKEETSNGTLIKVPYFPGFRDRLLIKYGESRFTLLRQVLSLFQSLLQFVSVRFDGKRDILFAAQEYIQANPVDFITATGEPFVLFRYAKILSKKHNLPWLADYRDCWSNFFEISGGSNFFERLFNKRIIRHFEKRIVGTSSLITCPGIVTKDKIQELFPEKEVKIIYNGFFEEEVVNNIENRDEKKELIISFGGTIYPFQPLELFLEGLLIAEKRTHKTLPIKVKFIGGSFFHNQKKRIEKLKEIQKYIEVTQRVSREELLACYLNSDFLLLLSNKRMISGKLFDYIKVGKPIVLVGEDGGEMEQIIQEKSLGYVFRTADDLADFLIEKSNKTFRPALSSNASTKNDNFFSRRVQARNLCDSVINFFEIQDKQQTKIIKFCPVCNSGDLTQKSTYNSAFLKSCKKCGFVFSEKIPDEDTLTQYYQNYSYTDAYYSSPLTWVRYNQILEKMEVYRKNNRFLDVGCGNGDFLMAAKERGWECWGTEFSEKAVEVCQNKGLNVFHGPLGSLKNDLPEFDVVVSVEVLEHINTPHEEIGFIYSVLREGGLFYLTTPNFNSLMRYFLKNKFDIITYPEHLGYFTPKSLSFLLTRNNFKIIKITTTGFSFNRFINSLAGKIQDPFTPKSIDERFRKMADSNLILKSLKNLGDAIFIFFGIGLSLKGWFEKKSSGG